MRPLCLLSHLERVIYLDTQVANSALKLCVPEQQLHGSQVLCSPINQGGLCPPKRMRSVTNPIQSDLADPGVNDSGVLPRR